MRSSEYEQFFLDSVSPGLSRISEVSSLQVVQSKAFAIDSEPHQPLPCEMDVFRSRLSDAQTSKSPNHRKKKKIQGNLMNSGYEFEKGIPALVKCCIQSSIDSSITNVAGDLYRRSCKMKGLGRGSREARIGACIYLACGDRTYEEVAKIVVFPLCRRATRIADVRKISVYAKKLATNLDVDIGLIESLNMCAEYYVSRYAKSPWLMLSESTISLAIDIIIEARSVGITRPFQSKPLKIAAGSIYFTCCFLGIKKPTLGAICDAFSMGRYEILPIYRILYANKEALSQWMPNGLPGMDRLVER